MEDEFSIAYLRELQATRQCELRFPLKIDGNRFGIAIDLDVQAVRKITDTVSSLLQHIINKIVKVVQDKRIENEMEKCENLELNVPVSLRRKTKNVKGDTVLQNLIIHSDNLVFQVFDEKFIVKTNAPLVVNIQLPEIIYANFLTQPVKFRTIFSNYDMSQFRWYKSLDRNDWTLVGEQYEYQVSEDDVGHYLKFTVIPKNEYSVGPVAQEISKSIVELIPQFPPCPFETRHAFTKEFLRGNEYRLVSYNVLSSRYSETNEQFPYCPPKFLAIDYRKQLIMKELLGYNGDIICLQEVDSKQYNFYYKEQFKNNGYGSVYHKKGFRISEGLACAFNKTRFKLIKTQQLVLAIEVQRNKLFTRLWDVIRKNEDVKRLFLRQATSLQVTILKAKECNMQIIVANTHLFYHPDATHIRLLQINMATIFINYLRTKELKAGNDICVMLCGDFNSGSTSPVITYVIEGRINPSHDECIKVNSRGITLYHEMCFQSACGFPKYTNYTEEFKGCLDYIFTEKNKIAVLRSIPLPLEEDLAEYDGLPNEVYPSDHLALVVDVKLL